MGVDSPVIEAACRELGIDVRQKHLSQLSAEEVARLKKQLDAGSKKGALKDARVDGTVVRRRKKVEDEPAAVAAPAAGVPATQVAGGAGAIATSATTVRRKRAVTEEIAPPSASEAYADASRSVEQAWSEPEHVEPAYEPEPVRMPEPEPEPAAPPRAAVAEPKPAVEARPAASTAPAAAPEPQPQAPVVEERVGPTDNRAVIVGSTARPVRRVESGGRSRQPEAQRRSEPTQPHQQVEAPRAPEPQRPTGVEARPAPTPTAPAAQAQSATAAPVASVPTATAAPIPGSAQDLANRGSLVQVVRRVDDAIMQNLLNEAQRRAERQNRDMRGPDRRGPPMGQGLGGFHPGGPSNPPMGQPGGFRPGGPGGPAGPGGPGGPLQGIGARAPLVAARRRRRDATSRPAKAAAASPGRRPRTRASTTASCACAPSASPAGAATTSRRCRSRRRRLAPSSSRTPSRWPSSRASCR
ncbi:MAG: hypothetical protein U1F43_24760 [Myxococcota bacterium]